MVNKTNVKRKRYINAEKYVFLLLILFYITGLCCGCYFAFTGNENIAFIRQITDVNLAETLLFFIFAMVLKYAGVLCGVLYTLPLFAGIKNAVNLCTKLTDASITKYSIVADAVRDSAIVMLIILYIIVLISQIINNRFSIKKDIRYLSVYLCGTVLVILLHYIFTQIIFHSF